jgi:hypothetical protein
MITILPQQEAQEYRITRIDYAVKITAVSGLIKFSQRQETISIRGRRLGCEVSEQLDAALYDAVSVTIKREPCFI